MSSTADRIQLAGKINAPPPSRPQGHNDYWKVPYIHAPNALALKAELERRRYHTAGNKNVDWLRESLIRAHLGQTSYDRCTNAELRAYIAARGIDTRGVIGKGKKGLRKDLLKLLDHADQNPRFANFTRLPPEIRNRVYALYFAALPEPLATPVQPPLTLASRQLRAEALQMFYHACRFAVAFALRRGVSYTHSTQHAVRLHCPAELALWFGSLSRAGASALRRLRVEIRPDLTQHWWRNDPNFGEGGLAWFELDIEPRGGDGGRDGRTELRVRFPEGPSQYVRLKLEKSRAAVAKAVARINARSGVVRLTVDDLKALRRAMEA